LNKSIKKSRIIKETLARVKRNHGQNLKIISQYGGNFIVTMKNGVPVLHSTDPKASENQVVFTQLGSNIESRPTTAIPGIVQKYCYLFAK
jgi:hypothetical protein